MLHCAVRSADVIHLTNLTTAARCADEVSRNRKKFPPPVGDPRRRPAGSIATPKSKPALFFTLVRLPVVVHIIAVRRSRKSRGVVAQSMSPGGITLCLCARSTQYCRA